MACLGLGLGLALRLGLGLGSGLEQVEVGLGKHEERGHQLHLGRYTGDTGEIWGRSPYISVMSPQHLAYTSPTSCRLYLPTSHPALAIDGGDMPAALYLPYISLISRLYLPTSHPALAIDGGAEAQRVRCRGDRVLVPGEMKRDIREIQARYRGDIREIQGRYRGGIGEI